MPAPTRIDTPTWAQIKHDYIILSSTPSVLSQKYGASEKSISQRVDREGWYQMRLEAKTKLEDDLLRESAKTRLKELVKFNEDDLKLAKAIRAKVARRLHDAENDPESKAISSSELRTLAATCDTAQKMGRLALGATTQNAGLTEPDDRPFNGGDIASSIVDVPIDNLAEEQRDAIIDKFLGKLA